MAEGTASAWLTDYRMALGRARSDGKLLLVQFLLSGRPLCETMEDKTLAAPAVATLIASRLVAVKLAADQSAELFERFVGGTGALASAVIDAREDSAATLAGFVEAGAFLRFLQRALDGYPAVLKARTLSTRRPREAALRVALARAYERAGGAKRAEEEYAHLVQALDGLPKRTPPEAHALVQAHERLARFTVMRGRNLEARVHLDRARALDRARTLDRARPLDLDPLGSQGIEGALLLTEGLALAVERRAKEAKTSLEEFLARHARQPDRDHALFALGLVRHDLRDDAGALQALGRVMSEHPDSRFFALAEDQIRHIKNPEADHQH